MGPIFQNGQGCGIFEPIVFVQVGLSFRIQFRRFRAPNPPQEKKHPQRLLKTFRSSAQIATYGTNMENIVRIIQCGNIATIL